MHLCMVIGQLSYMEYVPNEQTTKKGTPMNRRKYIQAAADIIHSIQTDSYYFYDPYNILYSVFIRIYIQQHKSELQIKVYYVWNRRQTAIILLLSDKNNPFYQYIIQNN